MRSNEQRVIVKIRLLFFIVKELTCAIIKQINKSFMCAGGSLADRLCEQLRFHEMRAGAGDKITAVANQLQTPHIDFPVALYGILYRIPGFGKCGRVEDYDIVAFPLRLQLGKQFKDIRALEADSVFQTVQPRVFRCLIYGKLVLAKGTLLLSRYWGQKPHLAVIV